MDIGNITKVISSVGIQRAAHLQAETQLFEATLSLLMFQLHTMVLQSWQRFAENQNDLAEDAEERHAAQRQRAAELIHQRREIEDLNQDYRLYGAKRQAGKFRFHQSSHLHLAV